MKYVIGVLVILAVLFLLWWLFSRNKQRKLDEQRAEAATIRAEAEQRGGVLRGQENFAQQADERASTARQEAEERARQAELSAREAQRAEEEARQHRDELERSRRAHEAELRRADELDPDVEVAKDDPRPLPEDLDDDVRPLDETRTHRPVPAALSDNASRIESAPGTQTDPELARDSNRDRARDDEEGSGGSGAAATAAGAAAVGSAYAATRGNVTDEEAASRLASGADFSDHAHEVDVERSASRSESGGSTEWDYDRNESTNDTGRASSDDEGMRDDMTQDDTTRDDVRSDDDASANDATLNSDERGTRGAASDGEAVMITDVEDYASTEPLPAESGRAEKSDSLDRSDDEARRATDEGSRDDLGRQDAASEDDRFVSDERTTAGATTDDERTDAGRADADDRGTHDLASDRGASDGEAVMITDVEDYASTEPLPAESAGMGESSAHDTSDDEGRASAYEGSRDDLAQEDSTSARDGSTGTGAHEAFRSEERGGEDVDELTSDSDRREEPTTEETWEDRETATGSGTEGYAAAGDDAGGAEGTDAGRADGTDDETHGDRGDATHWPDGTDRINPVDSDSDSGEQSGADEQPGAGMAGDEQPSGDSVGGGWSRRISGVDEIRDGGYGVGSAAPLEDRGQPADHPIQAYRDTNTFRVPGSQGYDSAEPDVWFYDEESARRAGFNPSES
ncbi:sunset domain-containing protein [Knoellia sp. Soil729]|uniref:sunset domain-containing protein n=1 Tax=Knoellia sp. Soil729 TaxID=1736394 RepID=UPI0006F6C6C1|nr:hypothetical protein [Knoellia sp. Soil729]KRE42518.1 hypothetical protein ASG74_08905 [Knoellia sp. Soil729]